MDEFEAHRPYLFAIAYRMLGSAMDAEDMVQETFLRYQALPAGSIRSPRAFLATVISRLCVNQLQLARRTREQYIGPWLPEPLPSAALEAGGLEQRAEAQESVQLAFLVLLEQLQPFERAVFLLREVFEYEFGEIAGMLGKTEAACRRSFSRARQHLRERRPRFLASPEAHRELLARYLRAAQSGEMAPLLQTLAEGVVLWADGGGRVRGAVLRPICGRDAVARTVLGTRRFWPPAWEAELADVNGRPSLVLRSEGRAWLVLSVDAGEDGLIETIWVVGNPDKLARLGAPGVET